MATVMSIGLSSVVIETGALETGAVETDNEAVVEMTLPVLVVMVAAAETQLVVMVSNDETAAPSLAPTVAMVTVAGSDRQVS